MRITKASNILLIVIAAVVLCCTAACITLDKAGVKLPEWTGVGATKSQMEGRKYTPIPDFSIASALKGNYQDELEDGLSDHVPMRNQVLLANAALQRSSITLSSAAFGFECYPTYFESEYMRLTEEDAVNFIPDTWDEETEELIREYARGVAATAQKYPEKRFIVYVVPGAQSPSASPAYELMSSPLEPSLAYEAMSEELASTPNAWVLTSEYESLDAFYEDFFKGDHHWNILGALRAYANIGKVLGWDALDYSSLKDFGEYRFFGSTARSGLDTVLEPVFDIDYDFSSIEIETSKGKKKNADDHSSFYDYSPASGQKFAFHTYYYNTQPANAVFRGGEGDRRGLLVSNSYGAVISRPLSLRYSELYRTNDLHTDAKNQHLSADLEKADIDDVIFIAQPRGFKTAMEQSPNYFE